MECTELAERAVSANNRNHGYEFGNQLEYSRVVNIRATVGEDAVLIPIPTRTKSPGSGWNHRTVESLQEPQYLEQLEAGNIGVVLGVPSAGLCSIDIDQDDNVEPFLDLNPRLRVSLTTKGSRGANIWVRIEGEYPDLAKLKTTDGEDWGEWRATGGQTVIDGIHPKGNPYQRLVDASPINIRFDQIVWPMQLKLPWVKGKYQELVKRYGEPYGVSTRGGVKINQMFFAEKYAEEHKVIFEGDEREFFQYNPDNGLWEVQSSPAIKNTFKEDFCDAADEIKEPKLKEAVNSRLLGECHEMLKGVVEKRGAFLKRQPIIHVLNGVLKIEGGGVMLGGFHPDYYSRNLIPFNFDGVAKCPRFLNELLQPALEQEDIDLLQRWSGCALLGVNYPQRILLLTGEGGTGKSTFAQVIEGIIGVQNVASLRTNLLNDRFELAGFISKTLLTGKDVNGNFLNQEGAHVIKALSGGDLLDAELKNRGRVQIRGDFNFLITSNNRLWLRVDGDTSAWQRRLLMVDFTKPRTSKTIPKFDQVLLREEGSGILNWMIDGALTLLDEMEQYGGYQLTEAQLGRVERLVAESNSVVEFVTRCVKPDNEISITTDALTDAYALFCKRRGWKPLPASMVEKQLPNAMLQIHQAAKRNDIHGSQRGYGHFRVDQEGEYGN